MDQLEHKLGKVMQLNKTYRRRLDSLTASNLSLNQELRQLQAAVARQQQGKQP